MDIYSAEIQVNKLLNYVKNLSDTKPHMYQKSKDRLKELANTCKQVIIVISEVLQDEVLQDDQEDEFASSNSSDFNLMLDSMESQLSEMRQFLCLSQKSVTPKTSSVSAKKHAIFAYKQCLSMLSQKKMIIHEAEDCSNLLWSWFQVRFLSGDKNFKYNMKRFPNWVRDIVILYGYHFENDSIAEFTSNFYDWLSSIPAGTNNYAVPYDVYCFDKSPDPKLMNLSAAVLWDILLDNGLRDLCANSSDMYPSEDCVYSLVGAFNSAVMDPYQNYLYDASILDVCHFTLKVGDEV